MARKELAADILLYLYDQGPDEKTPLSALCDAVGASSREAVEALDQLEAQSFVERSGLDRYTILCWITHTGRQIITEFGKQEIAQGAETKVPQIDHDEFDVGIPESVWNLDRLDPQQLYIVQRQDIVERIKQILEDPSGRRIVFLYGQPLVGKTFVLRQLGETLQDQYVPVYIDVNGWASTRNQLDFLAELAESIKIEIQSSRPDLHIEPFKCVSETQATVGFSRFMHDLAQSVRAEGAPFLLMFDELEYLAREEADGRIFEYLTGFVDAFAPRARFVFAGSEEMLDLLKRNRALATLLAKGRSVRVDCFDKETSLGLVIALVTPHLAFEPRALNKVVRLADGHPNLLKCLLGIIIHRWRSKLRKRIVNESDLSIMVGDVCVELNPKLQDIWCRLSMPEQLILQRIARSSQAREGVVEKEHHEERDLQKLVYRQILDYDLLNKLYTIRLGLLIESLSYGILSVSD
jgi:DNA-binding MarR family transcriptional regulator